MEENNQLQKKIALNQNSQKSQKSDWQFSLKSAAVSSHK